MYNHATTNLTIYFNEKQKNCHPGALKHYISDIICLKVYSELPIHRKDVL